MNILALDSSQETLSAALGINSSSINNKDNVFYIEVDAGPRHSELIMECVDRLFALAETRPDKLDLVACMKGPGSFTGLRIAYATAKGLAAALNIPMKAIPTLDCLAWHLSAWPGMVIPVMDAKQGRFFTALYMHGKQICPYMDASPKTLIEEAAKAGLSHDEKVILTGPGADLLLPLLTDTAAHLPRGIFAIDPLFRRGRARELMEIAKGVTITGTEDFESGPLYLRKSDAEINRLSKIN